MTPPHRLLALAAPLLLLACSREPAPERKQADPPPAAAASAPAADPATPPRGTAAAASAPAIAIEGEGLRLFNRATGSARPIPFGTPWAQALTALSFRGEPETGRNEECGAGPLDTARWDDSLTLYGQDGKFVGWFLDTRAEGRITTAAGIGPGTTRQDLEDAYNVEIMESTLGTEFAAGDLFGILDSPHLDSPITVMWAGTSCNMR